MGTAQQRLPYEGLIPGVVKLLDRMKAIVAEGEGMTLNADELAAIVQLVEYGYDVDQMRLAKVWNIFFPSDLLEKLPPEDITSFVQSIRDAFFTLNASCKVQEKQRAIESILLQEHQEAERRQPDSTEHPVPPEEDDRQTQPGLPNLVDPRALELEDSPQ